MAKKISKSTMMKYLGIGGIFIAAALAVILLMRPKETHLTTQKTYPSTEVLSCVSSNPLEPYLKTDLAINNRYEIKYIFNDDAFGGASLTYSGTFEDEKDTKAGITEIHSSHDFALQEAGIAVNVLKPAYTASGKEGILNLFYDENTLNAVTGKFLFLDSNESAMIGSYKIGDLQSIYEKKKFSCKNNI